MDFTLEELSMDGWPALMTVVYDGWVIRLSNGYSNRSNSINPIYPSKINMDEKINYCDELFGRHNLPAAYKLLSCEEHMALEHKLEALHYRKINETSVQTREISGISRKNHKGIIIGEDFDESWINSVIEFNKVGTQDIPVFKKILGNIAREKIVVAKKDGNGIAGCGYGIIGGGYVGVFDIVVEESQRGKGYGREIVETILSEAGKQGAEKSYLQVMLNNPAALHLYEKLGYKESYKYWYRKKYLN
jgi:ribosomal protein S18 acetylase RimI-like enzyme